MNGYSTETRSIDRSMEFPPRDTNSQGNGGNRSMYNLILSDSLLELLWNAKMLPVYIESTLMFYTKWKVFKRKIESILDLMV